MRNILDQGSTPRLPRLTPCGRTRREFIWQAGGGFVGTALTWLLANDGFVADARAGDRPLTSPLFPKPPHFAPKAKSCIFLFMYGGPSQVDLFDPKPELTRHHGQPIPNLENDPLFKSRNPGTLLGSSRTFTKHGQSGVEVSDLFPHLARSIDDIAIIRSCYADSFAHGSGLLQMNTGFVRQGYPSLGSWVTYGLGTVNQDLPAYVVLLDHRGGPIGGATDEFGFTAVENKVHVHDVHATILHLMGLDHEHLTYFHNSREMRLTDVEGRVVRELIA